MTQDKARLDGKLAIITGGGSGIGEATAHIFAKAGATVVVTGRRIDPLTRVADAIGGHAIACDVSDQNDVRTLFEKALKITGRVDILLNNAGGPGPIAPVAEVDMSAWIHHQHVILDGYTRLSNAISLCGIKVCINRHHTDNGA
jgi:NADP-dependent 3-hydroxy acid dehydrogenase YdfG